MYKRQGAIYPDIDKSGWNNEDSWFPEWHGGWQFTHYSYTIPVNYISCYEFVTRVALKSGNTSSFTSYTQIAGIDSAIFEWMKQDLNNINWNSALSGYTVNNANKKFFLWGCALHNLTDTFAHSTKYKNNGVIGNDIGHPDADDPTVRSNRFVVAKSAVSYSLKCLVNNVYGDYFEIYQALKYGKHDNSWVKKKLLPYAKSNAISLTSGETTYFTKASN